MSTARTGAAVVARLDGVGSTATDDPSHQVSAALREEWRTVIRRCPPAVREAWLNRSEVQAALGITICRQRLDALASEESRITQLAAGGGWVEVWRTTGQDLPLFYDDAGRKVPTAKLRVSPASRARRPGGGVLVRVRATAAVPNGIHNERIQVEGPQVRVGPGRQSLQDQFEVPAAWVEPQGGKPRRRGAQRLVLGRYGVRSGIEHATGTAVDAEPMAGMPHRRWTPPTAVALEDLIDGQGIKEACFYPHPGSPSADVINRIAEAGAKPLDGNW
ncbi:MAG TPA: hypothetical protein VGN72_04945 [Tepidisphaeraceae bacterium]|jgi:hypothetical protein|nr:hypothetical protein [Tepidisphaeraceae bacterium]